MDERAPKHLAKERAKASVGGGTLGQGNGDHPFLGVDQEIGGPVTAPEGFPPRTRTESIPIAAAKGEPEAKSEDWRSASG